MDKKPPLIGFKNEVARIKRQVPDVIRNYPEKQFWRFVDAPFFSAGYFKIAAGYLVLMVSSGALGIWAIQRFNLMRHKIFRGNTMYESELMHEFPDLDERILVPKTPTFSEKFKQREKERTEELKKAKKLKEQQLIARMESKSNEKIKEAKETKETKEIKETKENTSSAK